MRNWEADCIGLAADRSCRKKNEKRRFQIQREIPKGEAERGASSSVAKIVNNDPSISLSLFHSPLGAKIGLSSFAS